MAKSRRRKYHHLCGNKQAAAIIISRLKKHIDGVTASSSMKKIISVSLGYKRKR